MERMSRAVVVVELDSRAGQVCGPGSCGEESGLPRLASLAGASCLLAPQWLCLARFLLASGWWQAAGDDEAVFGRGRVLNGS